MDSPLSIWLIPAAPLGEALAVHVRRIATVLDAPVHTPHVTLLGDLRTSRAAAGAALDAMASGTRSLELEPDRIDTGASRFEALTIRFRTSPAFDQMAKALCCRLGVMYAPAPPHLSLVYPHHAVDASRLRALATGVPLAAPMIFDALTIVDPGAGRDDWEDVAAWRDEPPRLLAINRDPG
jgi:hypothetical protein